MNIKRLLILTLALGFTAAAAPAAKAEHLNGYYVTRVIGYDYDGDPIYRRVWVESQRPRYYEPSHQSDHPSKHHGKHHSKKKKKHKHK